MNNEARNAKKNSNKLFLLRVSYLIRKNFPTSNVFYILMFLFKYIGIIVNSRIIELVQNKSHTSIDKYLMNFFIFGRSFSSNIRNYQLISMIGAIILLSFLIVVLILIGIMKIKYRNIKTILDEKINKTNEKLEENVFRIITYIFVAIIFFHQYILEYYFFGIYCFIFNLIGIFGKNGQFSEIYVDTLQNDLYNYFLNSNHLLIFIINIIVVILIIFILFIFLKFNTIKALFLTCAIYSGNIKYIIMKIILHSLQPFFCLINFYNDKPKILIGLIYNGIIIFLCILSFSSCIWQYGYYPNNLANISLFIEIFVFVTSISEIILFFSGTKENEVFFIIKLLIQLVNSYFLMVLFLYQRDKQNLNCFAKNLFNKNFVDFSKGGLYFYMKMYLEYEKDKTNNYLKLFRLITTHISICNNVECPGKILIPKDYIKSPFVPINIKNISIKKENELENEIETNESEEENNLGNKNNYNLKDNNEKNDKKNNEKMEKSNLNNNNNINHRYNIVCDKEPMIGEGKKLNENQFQLIFEQEIINKIEYLYKTKKYCILEDYIFLHIQYLIMMKKNYSLALYFIGKYEKCGLKWSFITQYFLYEYKKYIISAFFNKTNINNVDESLNIYRKENHFLNGVIDYFVFSSILNKLIISSCSNLKVLFNFRKELHIPLLLKSYDNSTINNIFKTGEKLRKNIKHILDILRHQIFSNNRQTISSELSYVISNFFIFVENKIPENLRKLINPLFDINVLTEKLESGYHFFNMVHPLILALTKNNTFNIEYCSSVISNKLDFYQHELKHKDFHEMLFPGVKFSKQHELLMKNFLFFDYNSHSKSNTFLKTKEGYLQGVNFKAKKFPTFHEDFFMIIGIDFTDNKSENNTSFNKYSFFLDANLDFIFQTKNFFQDFEFNIHMFKELKTNFCDFFCINRNNFNQKLKKKDKNIFKKSKDNIYNLRKDEDAFILFKSIAYEKVYELRNIKKMQSIKNQYIIINDKINKDKMLKIIPKFSKLIEEYGLDFEWYQHFENLIERLSLKEIQKEEDEYTEYSKNMISLGLSSITKKNKKTIFNTNNSSKAVNDIIKNKNGTKEFRDNFNNNISDNNENNKNSASSVSLISKQNNNDKYINMKKILDRNFDVVYSLKKLGAVYYYLVDIYEKIHYKYDDETSSISEQKQNSILTKININRIESVKSVGNKNINENNQLIKAKTLFANKDKTSNKNLNFQPVKNILIKEDQNIENEDNFIAKVKTWASEKNLINIQEHLIKVNQRILNNSDIKRNNEIDTNIQKRNSSIDIKKKSRFERQEKKIGTKIQIKEKMELGNKSIHENIKYNNSINNNYNNFDNNSNNKVDDEEKIAFITKDKLKEYIQKSKILNRNYIIIIFILYALTIIIIGLKLIFARTNFSFASYLTLGMIYVEEIKSDIYIGSIIVLSQCFREDDEPLSFNSFSLHLAIKSQDLMSHINGFEKVLKLAHNTNLLSNVLEYLYNNITVLNLNTDWSQKANDDTYLLKELNYLSFLFNEQATQNPINNKCNFEDNFYLLLFESYQEIYNLNKEGTTSNQRLIHYILTNLLKVINPILSNILEAIIIVQIKTMNDYLMKVLILCIVLGIIVILIEIIFLIKNNLDINFIRELFVSLYHFEENNSQFEYQIYYLDITAKEFNINNLIQLENIKKSNYQNLNTYNINNSIIDEHNDKDNNNIKDSLINNLNKNSNKFTESLISKYQKVGNDLDQNSINGNLFNSSMVHLLNINNKDTTNKLKNGKQKGTKIKKNKNKKQAKNEIKSNIVLDKDKNEYKENEDTLEIIKTNKKIIPYSIRISIMISFFCFLFFMLTLLFNIYDIYKKKNIWEYAVNLSMNYLEKIPKAIEIGLSTILSIIVGRLDVGDYYSKEEYKEKQQKYMQYFTNMKNYEISELISSNIKDSYFANRLYDNYRIQKNIEYCENDKFFKGYFSSTKNMKKKINEKDFCIHTSYETVHFYRDFMQSLYEFFSYAESLAISCYKENEKLNDSGLELEIDLVLYELTNLYLEFEERMKTDINKARQLFFQNENFLRILKDMNIPFSLGIGALFGTVKVDMNNLIEFISFYEIFFISLSFILEILFLLYLIFIVIYIEKSKNILLYISKILKKINY